MARVTGIGGVFFRSRGDRTALTAWYQKHLGMRLEDFGGAILRWPDDRAEDRGLTVWQIASRESQWFSPSDSSFMINYRVDDLSELLSQLRAGGVEVLRGPESHENGKFAWIMGPGREQGRALGAEGLGRQEQGRLRTCPTPADNAIQLSEGWGEYRL